MLKRLPILFIGLLLLASCQTTPPDDVLTAPKGLTALAGNSQITLQWNANSEPTIVHYNVYQGSNKNNLSKASEIPVGTESYKATGLSNGTPYFFALEAEDTTGKTSARSDVVSAIPLGNKDKTGRWDTSSWDNTVWGE